MTIKAPIDAEPQWPMAIHAGAQAKMLGSPLGHYRSDLPAHVRDGIMKSAAQRARRIVELLERGDGRAKLNGKDAR